MTDEKVYITGFWVTTENIKLIDEKKLSERKLVIMWTCCRKNYYAYGLHQIWIIKLLIIYTDIIKLINKLTLKLFEQYYFYLSFYEIL